MFARKGVTFLVATLLLASVFAAIVPVAFSQEEEATFTFTADGSNLILTIESPVDVGAFQIAINAPMDVDFGDATGTGFLSDFTYLRDTTPGSPYYGQARWFNLDVGSGTTETLTIPVIGPAGDWDITLVDIDLKDLDENDIPVANDPEVPGQEVTVTVSIGAGGGGEEDTTPPDVNVSASPDTNVTPDNPTTINATYQDDGGLDDAKLAIIDANGLLGVGPGFEIIVIGTEQLGGATQTSSNFTWGAFFGEVSDGESMVSPVMMLMLTNTPGLSPDLVYVCGLCDGTEGVAGFMPGDEPPFPVEGFWTYDGETGTWTPIAAVTTFTIADTALDAENLTLNLVPVPPGDYLVRAEALDLAGNLGFDEKWVTVGGGGEAPPPEETGLLRVWSDPAVVTTIYVNGIPRDDWGLDWVKMPVGDYVITCTDVPGFISPTEIEVIVHTDPPEHYTVPMGTPVPVYANTTTEVILHFTRAGYLRVATQPPTPATIFVDNVPRDDWGIWVTLPPGTYTVSFEEVEGLNTPPPITVNVVAGETTYVIADYENGQSYLGS